MKKLAMFTNSHQFLVYELNIFNATHML
jgi:hypothetical protein